MKGIVLEIFVQTLLYSIAAGDQTNFDNKNGLFETEYDIIIVGGGTAGCILANKLSTNENTSVLLLEAGPSDDIPQLKALLEVPFAQGFLFGSNVDWNIPAKPFTNSAFSLINQTIIAHQGRVLGGSNSINGLAYIRPNPTDLNAWEDEGNEGWNYEEYLKYVRPTQSMYGADPRVAEYFGSNGDMPVERVTHLSELTDKFLEAALEMGYPIEVINGPDHFGFDRAYQTTRYGRRMSTSSAYLKPIMGRRNLHISTLSIVSKILIEKGKAVGVQYYDATGKVHHVRAGSEVVVSAGAINSPKLLMLSGIGPKQHLEEQGIKVLKNLPVGQNLKDQSTMYMTYYINESISMAGSSYNTAQEWMNYQFLGTGAWSNAGHVCTAFINSEDTSMYQRPALAKLYILGFLVGSTGTDLARKIANFRPEIWNELHGDEFSRSGFTILSWLNKEFSSGNVTLKSANPFDNPVVTMGTMQDPRDVENYLKIVRFIEQLVKTETFQTIGATLTVKHHPLCLNFTMGSDDYWRCAIRSDVQSVFHYTSTCMMGHNDSSVVDDKLRVHGIQNLRVADSSIIPVQPSGNIYTTVLYLAERAADIINKGP